MPDVQTEIIPYLFYRDVPAALEWLTRAFGFTEEMRTGTPSGGMHGQMTLDGQRIMIGQGAREWGCVSPRETGMATMGVFIYIKDVDGHHVARRRRGRMSCTLRVMNLTAAPIPSAISTAIPGSSLRRFGLRLGQRS